MLLEKAWATGSQAGTEYAPQRQDTRTHMHTHAQKHTHTKTYPHPQPDPEKDRNSLPVHSPPDGNGQALQHKHTKMLRQKPCHTACTPQEEQ